LLSQSAADHGELEPTLAAIPAAVGVPARVLVDSGFVNSAAFGRVMERGVEVYGGSPAHQPPYSLPPPRRSARKPRGRGAATSFGRRRGVAKTPSS